MALVTSTDYGTDEPSAQALLQRHRDLQGELNAYSGDIHSLNIQADKLVKSGINNLEVMKVTALFLIIFCHFLMIIYYVNSYLTNTSPFRRNMSKKNGLTKLVWCLLKFGKMSLWNDLNTSR